MQLKGDDHRPEGRTETHTHTHTGQFPRRVGRVVQHEIDGEIVLYDPKRNRVHTLNPTAAVIWQLCDGSRTADQLAEDMAILYTMDLSVIKGDLSQMLRELEESHLLRHGTQEDD